MGRLPVIQKPTAVKSNVATRAAKSKAQQPKSNKTDQNQSNAEPVQTAEISPPEEVQPPAENSPQTVSAFSNIITS